MAPLRSEEEDGGRGGGRAGGEDRSARSIAIYIYALPVKPNIWISKRRAIRQNDERVVSSGGCRIPGMRKTRGESGVELVPWLARGSKEGRSTALERFEGR